MDNILFNKTINIHKKTNNDKQTDMEQVNKHIYI